MSLEGVPNQKKYKAEVPTIEATNFEVIDVNGKPMRVTGYTAPEGSAGQMKILENITAKDIKDNLSEQEAEQAAYNHVMKLKETNPLINFDQQLAFWKRAFKSGPKMEADINEAYAKRGESFLKDARETMLELEAGLNSAQSDEEKNVIFRKIEELRKDMNFNQEQIDFRRSQNS